MDDFFQFLAANPEIATTVTISFGILVFAVTLMFIIAFAQGREVSLWPPKIGPKAEAKKISSQVSAENHPTNSEIKLKPSFQVKSRFFEIKPNDSCYIVLNNNPRSAKSMTHGDVEALVEAVKIVSELGGNVEIAPFDERPKGAGIMTEFCIGGPDSNERTKAHLRNHFRGLTCNPYSPGNADSLAIVYGATKYQYEKGEDDKVKEAYAILAKFRNDELPNSRPIFLICGQTSATNKCAIAYLIQNYEKLANEFKDNPFCLIVKPRDFENYGYQDVIRINNLSNFIFSGNE